MEPVGSKDPNFYTLKRSLEPMHKHRQSSRTESPFLKSATILKPKGIPDVIENKKDLGQSILSTNELRDDLIRIHLNKINDYIQLQSEVQAIRIQEQGSL